MNLIQQLSSAALHATKSQLGSSTVTSTPGQQNDHSTATVSALLDQLASSIASIHEHQQRQQRTDGTGGSSKGVGPAASAHGFVQQVQAGLQASNEQLQRLMSQQISAPHTLPQGTAGAAASKQAIRGPLSLEVLRNLLQLAVGSKCFSCTVEADLAWELGHQQQDHWHRAAWEAVRLFSFQELEQLPPDSLQQALLLHPQLLDSFLEAAAAAVLQPVYYVVQCSTNSGAAASHSTTSAVHKGAHNSSSADRDPWSEEAAGGKGVQNMQSLLSASCPWIPHLPGMLAQNPLLLLKAPSTLLSWFEAAGYVRLLQLLSTICRPAWQQLTAAAVAAAVPSQGPADPAFPAVTASNGSGQLNGCGTDVEQQKQRVLAGYLNKLCPLSWQQQLVMQLSQEPSVEGLLLLLQHLPGLASGQQQQTQGDVLMDVDTEGRGKHGTAAAAASWSKDELMAWPQPQEWAQPAAVALGQGCRTGQEQGRQQQAARHDRSKVLLAWELVMQHHCWYQFACALLVRSTLQHVQQHQQQQQLQRQQLDWTTAVEQLEQLLTLSEAYNQQKTQALSSGPFAAAAAAAFIAWVHQPVDLQRQASLMQRLMSASSTAASSSSNSSSGGARQPHPPDLQQAAGCLLKAWTASLKEAHPTQQQQQQQQQQMTMLTGRAHSDSGLCSTMWVSPVLYMCDLPCAVLQQKQLLLSCIPEQLVSMCIAAASSDPKQQQQPAQSGQQVGASGGAGVLGRAAAAAAAAVGVLPVELQCQLLDCSNDLCAAALEVVNLIMQHKARPPPLLQQQQQGSNTEVVCVSSATSTANLSWLARQWLEDDDAGVSLSDHSKLAQQGSCGRSFIPDLAVAKRLLAASTGVDQQLKQYAKERVVLLGQQAA